MVLAQLTSGASTLAMPKSPSLTMWLRARKTLLALMSRWMTP